MSFVLWYLVVFVLFFYSYSVLIYLIVEHRSKFKKAEKEYDRLSSEVRTKMKNELK